MMASDSKTASRPIIAKREPTRPVLVTGAPCSGTTWVGHVLCAAPTHYYVHEPFGPYVKERPFQVGLCSMRPRFYYQYVDENNEAAYYRPVARLLDGQFDYWAALRAPGGWRQPRQLWRRRGRLHEARERGARPLVKDPLALFATPWLARRFDIQVLILVRHPAAFVSSICRLGWWTDFNNFLGQPALLETYLSPYIPAIEKASRERGTLLDQAILLWQITFHTIQQYRAAYPGWLLRRHEDMAADPAGAFAGLCQALDIPFTARLEAAIAETSGPDNPAEALDPARKSGDIRDIKRHAPAVINLWRQRLNAAEIAAIRRQTAELAADLYPPDSWERV